MSPVRHELGFYNQKAAFVIVTAARASNPTRYMSFLMRGFAMIKQGRIGAL
jgi:hypothetical protein